MRPRVVVQNSVSADGRIDFFKGDVGLYYSLAAELGADATLTGADTILSSGEVPVPTEEDLAQPKMDGAMPLFLVDSRGRVKCLAGLKAQPYFSDLIVICTRSTPTSHLELLKKEGIDHFISGDGKVDLVKALGIIHERYGIDKIRIDSGGSLNGALMREKLVDEVVLLINPYAVGGTSPSSWYKAPDLTSMEDVTDMRLVRSRKMKGGVQLLHYEVIRD